MIHSVIKEIVAKGINTNYFTHYKDRRTFEVNRSNLPNDPSFTECQKNFTFPGHIIQNIRSSFFQGAIYFNYAVNPSTLDIFNNQSNGNQSDDIEANETDQTNVEKYNFTDDYNQSFIILNSELSNNKAFFNRIFHSSKDNIDKGDTDKNNIQDDINVDKFEYIFAAIYPFNIDTFKKMQGYKVIIHNI